MSKIKNSHLYFGAGWANGSGSQHEADSVSLMSWWPNSWSSFNHRRKDPGSLGSYRLSEQKTMRYALYSMYGEKWCFFILLSFSSSLGHGRIDGGIKSWLCFTLKLWVCILFSVQTSLLCFCHLLIYLFS